MPVPGRAVERVADAHVERRVGRTRVETGLLDKVREHLGNIGKPLDPVAQRLRGTHQLEQAVAGYVTDVRRRGAALEDRGDEWRVQQRRLEQGLAECDAA